MTLLDTLQLILGGIACGGVAWAMIGSRIGARRAVRSAALDEALERIRQGEKGVRLEPGSWGDEARLASRINAALARIESGTYDWDEAGEEERELFSALRGRDADGGGLFMAIAEVDRFTTLRTSIGFAMANQLLAELGSRIRETIDSAEIGRVGRATIEFAFRAESNGEAQLKLLAAIEAIERRITIDGFTFELSVTIGFADAATSSIREELVDRAAAALAAGQGEHVKVCFATDAVLSRNGEGDIQLIRELPAALERGEITLHYQPKLDARADSIKGAEALLRWHHPTRGLVPTQAFIQLAEETGAIRELSEWVLARAVQDQAKLAALGHDIEIFVNMSGMLLPDREFAEKALALVAPAAGRIGFEITETAVIHDPDAALANLNAFSEAGIRIAIDDYGSGLSSLAYLKQLPANELKIDRLFVSGLTESHRDPLIVRSSIDLAHALEMEVTAEGVDDAMALSLLRIMGCDLLQGYHISPPIPLDELVRYLDDETQLTRLSAAGATDWRKFAGQ